MFYKLINAIKFNMIIKREKFMVENNKNNVKLINLFIRLNIIKFSLKKGKKILVCINKKIYFRSFKNMYKSSQLVFLTMKNLKKMTFKRGGIFILSTDKGLMTNIDAIRKNTGGLLIAYLII